MNFPNFLHLDPQDEHCCYCCKRNAYDLDKGHICTHRKLVLTTMQNNMVNDCSDFSTRWENDFKALQAGDYHRRKRKEIAI